MTTNFQSITEIDNARIKISNLSVSQATISKLNEHVPVEV